jgi:hypothetical protein
MLRIARTISRSLAVLIVAGAIAPVAANAWPLGKGSHLHPAEGKDAQVAVMVHNRGKAAQDLKVDGQIYTVQPNASVTIKAPVGTQVFAATPGAGYQSGDVLFSVTPQLKGTTVSFN